MARGREGREGGQRERHAHPGANRGGNEKTVKRLFAMRPRLVCGGRRRRGGEGENQSKERRELPRGKESEYGRVRESHAPTQRDQDRQRHAQREGGSGNKRENNTPETKKKNDAASRGGGGETPTKVKREGGMRGGVRGGERKRVRACTKGREREKSEPT